MKEAKMYSDKVSHSESEFYYPEISELLYFSNPKIHVERNRIFKLISYSVN